MKQTTKGLISEVFMVIIELKEAQIHNMQGTSTTNGPNVKTALTLLPFDPAMPGLPLCPCGPCEKKQDRHKMEGRERVKVGKS